MSNVFDIGGGVPPQQPSMNVDLAKAEDLVCENCGSHFFNLVFMFKKISALMSPNGKPTMAPIETFACIECGTVAKELLPKALKNDGSQLI
jgi:uncharacterized Zn finger protein